MPARRRDAGPTVRLPERYWLPLCLAVQAGLLFWRLDLLPAWGDEYFTLDTSVQPLAGIGRIVRGDIHPPLYYALVHYWLQLPWSASLLVKARAFSGIWALASTVALHRLWFRDKLFLLLWTFSPCLILYGRMGRSYTLQLFLACLALHFGLRLIGDPRSRRAMWMYAGACTLLLYTHYLPAGAIILAVGCFLALRRAWTALAAPIAVMGLAYAPWLIAMQDALGRVLHAEPYSVSKNWFLDQALRLVYLPLSFTLGESASLWVLIGGALLAPVIGVILWRSFKAPPDWLPLVSLATLIAYLGAGRWISFAFTPARLLFALPFYLALLSRRAWLCAALVCLWMASFWSYFHKQDFLNKGYLLPFEEIAAVIQQEPAQLIVDAPGLDVSPLTHQLTPRPEARFIWVLSSRGRQYQPPAGRVIRRLDFVPYSGVDRFMMKLLDWDVRPAYALELTEYEIQ